MISIHRRVQPTVMSARLPAKASGANTAETTMSALRTRRAAHTITLAAMATIDKQKHAGRVADGQDGIAAQQLLTHLVDGGAHRHLHHPGREGVGGGQQQVGDRHRGPAGQESNEQPFDRPAQATRVASQHRGDDLDDKQSDRDDPGDGRHHADIEAEGRAPQMNGGGLGHLSP